MNWNRRQLLLASGGAFLSLPAWVKSATDGKNIDQKFIRDIADSAKTKDLTVIYPKGCLANLKPIIQQFSKLTSVQVKLKEVGFNDITNHLLKTRLIKGRDNHFDIAIPPSFSIPDLAEADVIQEFDNDVSKMSLQDYETSLYSLGDYYADKLFGLQTSGDAYMLFLRKSWLLDKKNQDRYRQKFQRNLEIPQTWEELDRQLAFFHKPSKNQYGGCFFRHKLYMHWEYWIRLHGKGLYPCSADLRPQLTVDSSVTALEEMKSATRFLHPSCQRNGPYENFSLFNQGNCYANLSWGGWSEIFLFAKVEHQR
ncbi:MAG: hypothetical protein HRU19_24475 [Pseudobacteriovorax sp.]|nr:hypothetical protein [Pseudobacteriovorax sp.]